MMALSLLDTSASNSSPTTWSLHTRSSSNAMVELSVCEGRGDSEEEGMEGDEGADEADDADEGGEVR